jgi:hypothetical protein
MSQTVRYARVRAMQDPDCGENETFKDAGIYQGSNIPYPVLAACPLTTALRARMTRGACVSGESARQ